MCGSSWVSVKDRILEKVVPDKNERGRLDRFRSRVEDGLSKLLTERGFRAIAEVHGSAVRDTWLACERDIDVFIILDGDYRREILPQVLDVVKEYVGEGWVAAYAEHPYIRAVVDEFNVDFVPCFRIDPKGGLVSATDRTPLHTGFVLEKLMPGDSDEVRLLKRFMKGVGVYGAEVRVGGFSGYLCELLVIRFGSFMKVLKEAVKWSRGEVLDFGGSDLGDLGGRPSASLIVVDPVDAYRNVASAVSETSLWTFVAAAKAFLNEPRVSFFYPEEPQNEVSELLEVLVSFRSRLLFVLVDDEDVVVPDVLWGQLYKTKKALVEFLRGADFKVVRDGVWSDETSRHLFVFKLESDILGSSKRRMGPPVRIVEDGIRFVEAHLHAEDTVSGPWIEGDRWWVEKLRPVRDARILIESVLEDGGRSVGVSKNLAILIKESSRVLAGDEIGEFLEPGLSLFLYRFLRDKPVWLE
jgi:tRNA nucleotidyltransferase (CCA-adding enzyme)